MCKFGNSITAGTDGGSFKTNNNGARRGRTLNVKRPQVKQGIVSQSASLLFTDCPTRAECIFMSVMPHTESAWTIFERCATRNWRHKTHQSRLSEVSPSSCSAFTNSILFFKHVPFLYMYGQLLYSYTMWCNTCSDVSERIGSSWCWSDEGEENKFVMLKGWRESGHTNTHKQKSARKGKNFSWWAAVKTMDMWEVAFLTLGTTSTAFHTG